MGLLCVSAPTSLYTIIVHTSFFDWECWPQAVVPWFILFLLFLFSKILWAEVHPDTGVPTLAAQGEKGVMEICPNYCRHQANLRHHVNLYGSHLNLCVLVGHSVPNLCSVSSGLSQSLVWLYNNCSDISLALKWCKGEKEKRPRPLSFCLRSSRTFRWLSWQQA